jgi:acid phosphatase type 7
VVVHPKITASGEQEVAFFSNGSARSSFDGAVTDITLRARGRACEGNPQLKVYVDDALKGTVEPTSTTFADYKVALSDLSAGTHNLRISFENDFYKSDCDRNAFLDYYNLSLPDPPPPSSPVLVGAGKIASCSSSGDAATARLLDSIPGTVFTAGDNAYPDGTTAQYNNCYNPTWGRHKARTMPTPGQHDYDTPGASGYFGYFGAAAGDPTKGYYSYNLGEWHIIALNSQCGQIGGCGATSPMVSWLKQDLAANPNTCTLAYFHHPLFSSGAHGNQTKVRPIWDALYAANADVVVNARDHDYERFAPQDPSGTADASRGIREFVVGTGGAFHAPFGTIQPNSEVRNADTYGVLKFTLHPSSYDWQFVPVEGQTFSDSGTTSCH